MKTYEYKAKKLFEIYGIPVEKNLLCSHAENAAEAYREIGSGKVAVKAQVTAGGRGKAGGVKIAGSEEETVKCAREILGMDIKGFKVEKVSISEAVDIQSEYYLGLVIDRNMKSPVLMLSREGGMDIETIAASSPEKIKKLRIDIAEGMTDFLAREAGFSLFDTMEEVKAFVPIVKNLYRLFMDKDASLVEINPLVKTKNGRILALDAKMSFDDNALFRHPDIKEMDEPGEEEKTEQYAKGKGFSYVQLEGEIGCMVNGAGLAMVTMDVIRHFGGRPANFLDIGGSSNPEKVVDAIRLLLRDKNVKVVMINIFGGITRCDDVAKGLKEAFFKIETKIPVVIRLTGTNAPEGREILKGCGFILADSMEDATQKAIACIK